MTGIIAYFSRGGENYLEGAIKTLTVGNTEVIAEILGELTGLPLFKIEPLIAYSNDYSKCIEEAKRDLKRDARPELITWSEEVKSCDTIYLGYPNYWGTMPMAVFSFLEHYDFTGKTIKPFCTHEGSKMGRSESDIQRLCPTAKLTQGLAIPGSRVQDAESDIRLWLKD